MSERITRALRLKTDPGVFLTAVGVVLAFVVVTFVAGDWVGEVFGSASGWIMTNLGWFYIAGVSTFLLFLLWIALSRFGHVRLGSDDELPEHSTPAWFGMLFAAGIGTILMFWGVAEPISHFATPPRGDVEPGSVEAAQEAMSFTLYHFGLHTWTIFALPALAFAYFIYKRKMPPRVSSIFAPILGQRVYGPLGKTIDVVALVGTVFGVATSVGLGTLQINAGLNELFGIAVSPIVQVMIIVVVTTIACISVAAGLDKGIKRLSTINIVLAISLLVFIIATGPTLFLLKGTVESFGVYASSLPELAFWNNVFPASDDLASWQNTWTVFYWAWTITWSPFVGIFIARISRGRTIRQFVFGVLVLPVAFSIIWFGVFGMASFDIELNGSGGLVEAVVDEGDIPGALFAFLSNYPLATLISGVAVLLVVIFFTTSVDSAAMVVDMMASGRDDSIEPSPAHQRIIWGVLMGAVAATLLAGTGTGGLDALQEVITVIGLPFFVMGFVMMYSLVKGISADLGERPPTVTRQWERAYSPEEFEENETSPSPEPIGPLHRIPGEEDDGAPNPLDTSGDH
ncbi:BCCT family transporter [Dietzia sp. PP-33]|jgi:choline/glycine/proline betaine transport protein|uniref:BCCT family transporter n=1 Tax=Dietzia sp. PP-33 TaxID=2957500 RepID=UPI0029B7E1AB|nr:BCCT family transporter [Dietzia sp. PP-33]MDX2356460.1 BCCT family transporter [Dietzia sp. PP-33]